MTTPPDAVSKPLAFNLVLMWAMVAATGAVVTLPVVASFVIGEFSISRAEFGLLLASLTIVSALGSPLAGRVTDVIGGRNALLVVFASSALSLLVLSAAPVFPLMFGGAVVALGGAAANPSTNKLIATYIPSGRRGAATGIKQSGPQVGSFVAGILAPWGATTIGWRPTLAIAAGITALALPFAARTVPVEPTGGAARTAKRSPLPTDVRWVAAYGFLVAVGGSATFLVPLFAEESLGMSPRTAGLAAALMGAIAILGRLGWGRLSDRGASFFWPLGVIALLSMLAALLFLASIGQGVGLMWAGVVLIALSSSSWTVVGALAVMSLAGSEQAGRASGLVWLGFLTGLGVGPPLYGLTVDQAGTYTWMWTIAAATFAAATALMAVWARRPPAGS